MNKLAVFVEGQTEQLFTEKLLIEIAGRKNIHIEKRELTGGRKSLRQRLYFRNVDSKKKYFAYIVDCKSDSTVKSDIVDNYNSLVREGYSAIIGIRDVYPIKRAEIPKLRYRLNYLVKTKPIMPVFILSVMEIEAWFLAEHTHFQRIHEGLTIDRIKAEMNFDPSQDNMELRDSPSQDLHQIYALEGLAYTKRKGHRERTVEALDYAEIYLKLSSKLQAIREFVSEIDKFMVQ
jgi:hypothetical protein